MYNIHSEAATFLLQGGLSGKLSSKASGVNGFQRERLSLDCLLSSSIKFPILLPDSLAQTIV